MNRDEDPAPFFLGQKWKKANDVICAGKLFTRSVC
jgi:hypothetical protein